MKIYFVEVESSERPFFESELADHEMHFVSSLEEVEGDAEIVSTFIYSRVDVPFLDRHPAVKLIATRSTTYDHLELESCAKRNVTMCIVPSYGDHVVAEHTFALLLAVARRLRESMTLKGDSHFSYEALRGFELRYQDLRNHRSGADRTAHRSHCQELWHERDRLRYSA